ncbi:hypothetical protein [Bacillus toyonensis]|uniref:hypothetical protein n=1 Tax=Bacillus toyonensis TaxID=155322 RepID=UPI002E21BF24|nr:hypothetical protein [Bacillus toyonensis]
MDKKHYILLSILVGWIVQFVFPISEPSLTYFLGIFIGVISLFYIPNEKYTHNVWIQSALWAVLLIVFPIYIIAGLAVGVGAHIGLDYLKSTLNKPYLGFRKQWVFTLALISVNTVFVTGVAIAKFLHY